MLTRKIGKLVRGNATPFQVLCASALAGCLAFVPAFSLAPGWVLTLAALLLILNANIGLALLLFAPLYLASLLLMPVTFQVGRFLLDGPGREAMRAAATAPVLAWFGLEYYATSGGIVMGLAAGLIVGLILNRLLKAARARLASLEQGSPRYQEFAAKGWVKALVFVFVGGRSKHSYEELLAKRMGNPVRIAGVAVIAVIAGALFFARDLLAAPVVTQAARAELERANGATVDLGAVDLDLAGGRLTVRSLALADPADLATDLFQAKTLEVDIDVDHLLRKRFTLQRVVVSDAKHGAPRAKPGRLIGPPRPVESVPPEGKPGKTLEDYLADAELWKQRLARARRVLERVSGGEQDEEQEAGEGGWRERLEQRVRALGYARVESEQLVADVPVLTIADLVIDGLSAAALEGEVFDVRARNLSTHPQRLQEDPQIDVRSRSGNLAFGLGVDADGTGAAPKAIRFHWKGLPVDRLASSLVVGGRPLLSGGTLDLSLDGSWDGGRVGYIDLPLDVTLRGSSIQLAKGSPVAIEELVLPIGLAGPLDAPRIHIDPDRLREALVKAGADRLIAQLESEVEQRVAEEKKAAQEKLESKLEEESKQALGKGLQGVFGKKGKPD